MGTVPQFQAATHHQGSCFPSTRSGVHVTHQGREKEPGSWLSVRPGKMTRQSSRPHYNAAIRCRGEWQEFRGTKMNRTQITTTPCGRSKAMELRPHSVCGWKNHTRRCAGAEQSLGKDRELRDQTWHTGRGGVRPF